MSLTHKRKFKSLQSLCIDAYLKFLEDACAVYIQLLSIDNILLAPIRDGMIDLLKDHLRGNLSGIASSSARDDMIRELLNTRKYPSKKYLHKYDGFENVPSDQDIIKQVCDFGLSCNSICCTGAFIVETMLCIIINEDVQEIRFENVTTNKFLKNGMRLINYQCVPFQLATILAHFSSTIPDPFSSEKTAKLKKFIVRNVDDSMRISLAFWAFNRTDETNKYLQFQYSMAPICDRPYELPLLLPSALRLLFTAPRDSFPNLTEIVLGPESCTSCKVDDYTYATAEILRGIGLSCPHLRILDLSTNGMQISNHEMLQLFFLDPYCTLHKYMFYPLAKLNDQNIVVQCTKDSTDYEVVKHDTSKYCFFCLDDWCCNAIREGADKKLVPFNVIDDDLYDHILETFGEEKAKHYLCHVLKAGDLVKSIDDEHYTLVRPGPSPHEPGFIAPDIVHSYDYEYPWYMPDKVEYKPEYLPYAIHKIAGTLEYLSLPNENIETHDSMCQIVPFLLEILPKLKSFGKLDVMPALRRIKSTPMFEGISARNLEELQFTLQKSNISFGEDKWIHSDILTEVKAFLSQSTYAQNPVEELCRDVNLISEECPNLKILHVKVCESFPGVAEDRSHWKPFADKLTSLHTMTFNGPNWVCAEALLHNVGHRLMNIDLVLAPVHPEPLLNQMFPLWPQVETLSIDFGNLSVLSISRSIHNPLFQPELLPNLKVFKTRSFITKKALMYMWARAPKLKELKAEGDFANHATEDWGQTQPPLEQTEEELSVANINSLFDANPMIHLEEMRLQVMVDSIEAARLFIARLHPRTTIVAKLCIGISLPQEEYTDTNAMAADTFAITTQLKEFKDYCDGLKATGRNVWWKWNSIGILKQMHNIVSLPFFNPDSIY